MGYVRRTSRGPTRRLFPGTGKIARRARESWYRQYRHQLAGHGARTICAALRRWSAGWLAGLFGGVNGKSVGSADTPRRATPTPGTDRTPTRTAKCALYGSGDCCARCGTRRVRFCRPCKHAANGRVSTRHDSLIRTKAARVRAGPHSRGFPDVAVPAGTGLAGVQVPPRTLIEARFSGGCAALPSAGANRLLTGGRIGPLDH